MKRFLLKLRRWIGFLIAFGVGTVAAFAIVYFGQSHIPMGAYAPLLMERGMSYEYNVSQTDVDDDGIISTWIREDRVGTFKSETGLPGSTMFTRVQVNCAAGTVAIFQQLVYDEGMNFIGAAKGVGKMDKPKSYVGVTAVVGMCYVTNQKTPIQEPHGHDAPPENPGIKTPSDIDKSDI